jgi:hypothetical protein
VSTIYRTGHSECLLHQRRLEKEWVWPAFDRTFRLTLFIKYRLSVIAPLSEYVQAIDRIDIVEKEKISNITWRILVEDSEYAKLRAYLHTYQQREEGMQSLSVVHGAANNVLDLYTQALAWIQKFPTTIKDLVKLRTLLLQSTCL